MHAALWILLISLFAVVTSAHASSLDLTPEQARSLKDAQYYLKDVEKKVPALYEQAQAVKKGTKTLTTNELQKGLNEAGYARQKVQNAWNRLQHLPANDASVKPVLEQMHARAKEIVAIEEIFTAAKDAGKKAVASVDGAQLKADTKRMREMATRVNYADKILNDPANGAEIVREIPRMIEFRDALLKTYGPILEEHEGSDLKQAINGFDYSLPGFREGTQKLAPQVAQMATTDLGNVRNIVKIAIDRRTVSSFTNGAVHNGIDRATVYVDLLEAILGKDSEVKRLRKDVDAVNKEVAAAHESLREEILAANVAPKDLYNGGDKDTFLAEVAKAWKKGHPKSEVLAMRVPMRKWERWTGVRWAHDHYQLIDESSLQVAIVVKADAKTAHVYYAHLKRDHQAGDDLSVRLDDRGEVPLYRTLLLANFE